MSRIGNIYLVWRKGPGSRRIPVGMIRRNNSAGVRFSYIQENLHAAKEQGFIPYTGFPDTDKIYTENVLDIFAQRLSKSERNDLGEFYKFWKIEEKRKTDPYYMLSKTQGILPIDNFEFLTNYIPKRNLTFISEIAGLSKTKIPSSFIEIGDILSYEKDECNEYDKNAVKLEKNGIILGYVKLIHSRIFYRTERKFTVKVHHIEKNGILKRVFIVIKL